jgi:hypothetical protein
MLQALNAHQDIIGYVICKNVIFLDNLLASIPALLWHGRDKAVLPDDIFKIPQLEARNPPKIMVFCRKTPKISNK